MREGFSEWIRSSSVLVCLSAIIGAVLLGRALSVNSLHDNAVLLGLADLVLCFVFYPLAILQMIFFGLLGDPLSGAGSVMHAAGLAAVARRITDLVLFGRSASGISTVPSLWAILFVFTVSISLTAAGDLPTAIIALLTHAQLLLLFLLIIDFIRSERELRWAMAALLVAGLASALVVIFGIAGAEARTGGIAGNANRFAIAQLVILCVVGFGWAPRSLVMRLLLLASSALIAYSVILAASRGTVMAAVGACAYYVIGVWKGAVRRKVGVLAGVLGVGSLILWAAPEHFYERIETIPMGISEAKATAAGADRLRLQYAESGIQMGLDHPWAGVGIGQFNHYIARYANLQRVHAGGAHNMYVSVFAETGVPGIVAFAGLLVSTLWAAAIARRRWTRRAECGPHIRVEAFELAMVALLFGGVFGTLESAKFMWVLMALAVATRNVAIRNRQN